MYLRLPVLIVPDAVAESDRVIVGVKLNVVWESVKSWSKVTTVPTIFVILYVWDGPGQPEAATFIPTRRSAASAVFAKVIKPTPLVGAEAKLDSAVPSNNG